LLIEKKSSNLTFDYFTMTNKHMQDGLV